ncbi:MAG: tetratricopeptide repeat protein [Alphaproteobacteria bacterium]|nr:tetratricopeptide repeat protein [Alphaproteobacteria bacterium]
MPIDCYGLEMTADSQEAADRYSETITAYLELDRAAGDRLKAMMAADPDMILGHCLRGYFFKLFAVPALEERAKKSQGQAADAVRRRSANDRERLHVAALKAWCEGDYRQTVAEWDAILTVWPRDILGLRLAHFVHFYMGDAARCRDVVARALPDWPSGSRDASYLRGMHAFGLEECGDHAAAEDVGRRALAAQPKDIWAVHAVAHVLEAQGRHREGIRWIDETAPYWRDANNFAYHVWWHQALHHYERREFDAVLALHDSKYRSDQSDEYLDITNACAMLLRLEDRGVDVGHRWAELTARCEARAQDGLMAFADAHYVMALVAGGREEKAAEMVARMRERPVAHRHQPLANHDVGAPLAEATIAYRRREYEKAVGLLLPIREQLPRIGGSHAQRDVFALMLIEAALKSKQWAIARALCAERVAQKPNSAIAWANLALALDAGGDAAGAERARGQERTALAA